jgi:hypothetical protein
MMRWHAMARHKVTWGHVSIVTSCPCHTSAVVASSLSVVGPWWALKGEGVSIGKDGNRMW